jgi:hypothetical protein
MPLIPLSDPARGPARGQRWRQALTWLPDVGPDIAAFCAALLCAVLAALLVGSIGGCGGGVGTEGTGTFASVGSGPITGFGSIVVSGVRYDDSTASVSDDDGQGGDRGQLALGMVVDVEGGAVTTAADGVTQVATATSVRTRRALLGPVAEVAADGSRLRVLGQLVLVTADTTLGAGLATPASLAALPAGQLLEIWGLYDASRTAWVATRIALAPAGSSYRISGPVAAVDGGQGFTIGSQAFAGSSTGLAAGTVVQLKLQPVRDGQGRWVVSTQKNDSPFSGERDGAGVEGVVATVLSASRFSVDGVTVDSSAARVDGTVQAGARVEVRGRLSGGVLLASRVKASAPDEAKGFELKGTPSGLDTTARRFQLRGVTVDYASASFEDGSAARLVGYAGTLEVKGRLSADRQVLVADSVEFKD